MTNITTKIQDHVINAKDLAIEARAKVGGTTTDYVVTYSDIDALIRSDARLVVWSDIESIFNYEFAQIAIENPDLPYEAMEDHGLQKVIAELGKRLVDFHIPSSTSATSNAIDAARFEQTQTVYRMVHNWR